jgi:hypothetical protein
MYSIFSRNLVQMYFGSLFAGKYLNEPITCVNIGPLPDTLVYDDDVMEINTILNKDTYTITTSHKGNVGR